MCASKLLNLISRIMYLKK